MIKKENSYWVLIILVLSFGASLRTIGINFGLPQRLHPDEWSQVEVGWSIAVGDLNPHFFRYPTAHMYILALVFKVLSNFRLTDTLPDLYLIGRFISVIFGLLTVGSLMALGHTIYGRTVSLLSGLLLAVVSEPVLLSHYATVDVPMVFWSTVSFFLITKFIQKNQIKSLFWASAAAGMAIATKYNAALLLLPIFAAVLFMPCDESQNPIWTQVVIVTLLVIGCVGFAACFLGEIFKNEILYFFLKLTSDGRLEKEYYILYDNIAEFLLAGCAALSGIALFVLKKDLKNWKKKIANLASIILIIGCIFILFSPFVIIDWPKAVRDIFYEMRHMQIGSAAQYPEGSAEFKEMLKMRPDFYNTAKSYFKLLLDNFGVLSCILVILGTCLAWHKSKKLCLLFGAFVFIYCLVIFRWANWASRYLLPVYPLLCLMAAVGLEKVACKFKNFILTLFICGVVFMHPILAVSETLKGLKTPETRELALAWTFKNIPQHTLLITRENLLDCSAVFERYDCRLEKGEIPFTLPSDFYFYTTEEKSSGNLLSRATKVAVFNPAIDPHLKGHAIYIYKIKSQLNETMVKNVNVL